MVNTTDPHITRNSSQTQTNTRTENISDYTNVVIDNNSHPLYLYNYDIDLQDIVRI